MTPTLAGTLLLVSSLVGIALARIADPGTTLTWWSSTGVSIALLVLLPRPVWPWIVGATVVLGAGAHLLTAVEPSLAVRLALSQALAAVVGALVLQLSQSRVGRSEPGWRQLQGLVLAALTVGVLALVLDGLLILEPTGSDASLLSLCVANVVWVLLLTPAVLTSAVSRPRTVGSFVPRTVESRLQAATLALGITVLFMPDLNILGWLAPATLAWAAVRLPAITVAVQLPLWAVGLSGAWAVGGSPHPPVLDALGLSASSAQTVSMGSVGLVGVLLLAGALAAESHRAEFRRIHADAARFRRTFVDTPVGMLFLRSRDGDLVVDSANAAALEMLEVGEDEALTRSWHTLLEVDPLTMRGLVPMLASGSGSWNGPLSASRRAGSRLDVTLTALPGDADSVLVAAQLRDVTQEHDAVQRLEAAQRFSDATLDSAGSVMLVTDPAGYVIRANSATKEITGFTEAELLGRKVWDTSISPMDREQVEALFLWPNRSGSAAVHERLSAAKDGTRIRLVWNCNVVIDETGQAQHAVFTGVDVTSERATAGLMTHLMQASIGTAVIGVDTLGKITVFNSGAQHLLGYTSDEVIGTPFPDLLEPGALLRRTGTDGSGEAFMALIGSIGDDGESTPGDWDWLTRDGRSVPVSMTISLTADAISGRIGFLCIGRDVTAQRTAQHTLATALHKERTAVSRLQALDRAKDDFVSTVSHELRTPITSIMGYTEMLSDGSVVDPSPEQLPLLKTIARNGDRLIAICNDLLLLGGLEAAVQLALAEVDLREILLAVQDSVGPTVRARTLEVSFDIPSEPMVITADASQVERIVANLVSNAVKFTPDGGWVGVQAALDGNDVVLTVRDSGMGIPEAEQAQIFARFFRAEAAQHLAIPGTGLGLSIVSAMVEAHHGTITLDSVPDEGSTFTVRLPVGAAIAAVLPAPADTPTITAIA